MTLELRQQITEEHRLVTELRQQLQQRMGEFEKQVLDKVEFVGIDIDDPQNEYQFDILRSLLAKPAADRPSIIAGIVHQSSLGAVELRKIVVESFEINDVGLKIGTKRDVDGLTLIFTDTVTGEEKTIYVTASIDRDRHPSLTYSPSSHEAKTLAKTDPKTTWCVQRFYGFDQIEDKDGVRGIVYKEFVPGSMLANLTQNIPHYVSQLGESFIEEVARAVGRMVNNSLATLRGIPVDSNTLNIILDEQNGNGRLLARYCDVEGLRTDTKGIQREIDLLAREFGEYAPYMTAEIIAFPFTAA